MKICRRILFCSRTARLSLSDDFITAINGQARSKLARLNTDGSFDATFQNPLYSGSFAFVSILPLSNGKILIGGSFSFVNGQFSSVARLNSNGTKDATFQIPVVSGGNARVRALAVQPDDKILISGDFSSVGGLTRTGLARLNADGTVDTTFQDPNVTNNISSSDLAIQKDGKIIIVGGFFTAGGQRRVGAARINTDGTLDTTFNDIDSGPNAVVIQPDGKIVIGGNFNFVSQRVQPYISRLLGTPVALPQKAQFDFDGDGKSDLSVFRSGVWFLNRSLLGFLGVQWGVAIDKLAPADYDGDGKTDIAVWREAVDGERAYFFILNSQTNTFRAEQFGNTGDRVTVGDWDNDGKADLSVYRDSAIGAQSYFYYRPSNQTNVNFVSIPWGATNDKPVRGDFDGDGKFDAAIFRPSSGTWIISQSLNGQPRYQQFGVSTDKPVPADYDGDGKVDVAVYRDGVWIILQSSNGSVSYQQFGVASDVPVPSAYIR